MTQKIVISQYDCSYIVIGAKEKNSNECYGGVLSAHAERMRSLSVGTLTLGENMKKW